MQIGKLYLAVHVYSGFSPSSESDWYSFLSKIDEFHYSFIIHDMILMAEAIGISILQKSTQQKR